MQGAARPSKVSTTKRVPSAYRQNNKVERRVDSGLAGRTLALAGVIRCVCCSGNG